MTDEEKTLGTKELAAKLKLDPKTLRKHLRAILGKAPGERYAWRENSAALPKLIAAIREAEKKPANAKK